jgi:hypothetical protein
MIGGRDKSPSLRIDNNDGKIAANLPRPRFFIRPKTSQQNGANILRRQTVFGGQFGKIVNIGNTNNSKISILMRECDRLPSFFAPTAAGERKVAAGNLRHLQRLTIGKATCHPVNLRENLCLIAIESDQATNAFHVQSSVISDQYSVFEDQASATSIQHHTNQASNSKIHHSNNPTLQYSTNPFSHSSRRRIHKGMKP